MYPTLQPYDAIATKLNEGKLYYLVNQHWNAAEPDTISPYCTEVQFAGTFGNTKPEYVSIEW